MSPRIAYVILALAGLYLVGNGGVQLWDRDEPRYAQTSRQMLQSGQWVVPRLLDEDRLKKPPLIYWVQAASMSVLGDNAMAARLPSAIGMTLVLVMMALVMKRAADETLAFWSVLVLGTSALVIMAAKMCITDAVLLLFVTGSQFCIFAIWRGVRSVGVMVGFGASLGLALLAKGPVVLGVGAMTLVVLGVMWFIDRRKGITTTTAEPIPVARQPLAMKVMFVLSLIGKTLLVLAIVAAITVPWVRQMEALRPGSLANVFKKEVVDRTTTAQEQHNGPPGYYLVFMLGSFLPWCLLLPTVMVMAWRNRREPLVRFAFAAVVGPWIMFEAVQTKLPHYVLPCFPFMAILAADTIRRAIRGEFDDWTRRSWMIGVSIWSAAIVAMGASPWFATRKGLNLGEMPYVAMTVVTIVAAIGAVGVWVAFCRRRIAGAMLWMAASIVLLFGTLHAFYLPHAPFLQLSSRVGSYLREIGATQRGDVVMIDYKEDTLPFYQGGTIRPQRANGFFEMDALRDRHLARGGSRLTFYVFCDKAIEDDAAHWPTYFVVTREIWERRTAEPFKRRLEVLKVFRGWAYAAKGRIVDVYVLKKRQS